MITGIKKTHKTTEIFFDEASDILIINTYNTSLKNRLTAYAKEYPSLCRQTDDNEVLSTNSAGSYAAKIATIIFRFRDSSPDFASIASSHDSSTSTLRSLLKYE